MHLDYHIAYDMPNENYCELELLMIPVIGNDYTTISFMSFLIEFYLN